MQTSRDTRTIRIDRTLDIVGVVLALLAAGWAVLASRISGGSPGPFLAVLAIAAAGLAVGRALGRSRRRLVAAGVLGATSLAFLAAGFGTGAWGDPLGYANASAALAVQGGVAGLALALPGSPAGVRAAGLAFAVGFALVPIGLDARAAGLLTLLVWISALVVAPRWPRRGVIVAGATFLVALVATTSLGAAYRGGERTDPGARAVDLSLSEIRVALWHDGLMLAARHPLFGVGAGEFPTESAVARADPDTRQAHNDFLQQAAEAGFPAMALAVLLVLWGFVRLYATRAADALTFLGGAALAAMAIGGSVDYVLRFPAVTAAAALLVGMGQAAGSARPERRRKAER